MTQPSALVSRIEKDLRLAFKPVTIGGHAGFAAPVKDQQKMIERARYRAVEMEREGAQLFVGLHGKDRAHRLFLMPGLSSLDLVGLFRVGTHDQGADAWREVDRALRKIHAEAPFSAYFADQAGYKAAFAGKVSRKLAKRFEAIIMEVNVEAVAMTDEGEIWPSIESEGIFQLWWD